MHTAAPPGLGSRQRYPERWSKRLIAIAAVAYSAESVFGLVFLEPTWQDRGQEILVALTAWVALRAARSRPRLAAFVVACMAWLELVTSLAQSGSEYSAPVLILPALIPAFGMLLGVRGAWVSAALTALAIPSTILMHRIVLGEPWVPLFVGTNWLLIVVIVVVGVGLLVQIMLRAFDEALWLSERIRGRLEAIFRSIPDGLLEFDAAGGIIECNPSARGLLKLEPVPSGVTIQDAMTRLGASSTPDWFTASFGVPYLVPCGEYPSNGLRTLEVTVTPCGQDGTGRLMTLRDVTERLAAEERARHAQRLETVGQLAGGVAHDFNNLLTVVGCNAEILALSPHQNVRDRALEILSVNGRAAALTRQLLAFSRKDVCLPKNIDLSEIVEGMHRLLVRILGERSTLHIAVESDSIIWADPSHIEQIVVNLVTNARDAMPNGGHVEIQSSLCDHDVARGLGSELSAAHQVVLSVSDNGVGMNPETQRRIFEPFFTTKPRGQGTGLGLATVIGIVRQWGGGICVRSTPHQGTQVRVFLPESTAVQSRPMRAMPEVEPDSSTTGRILVVEDEMEVMDLVRDLLHRAGFDVACTNDPKQVLELVERATFDLVVSDVMMPGLTGPELMDQLHDRFPRLPFLFLSGYVDESAVEVAKLAKYASLLKKPFSSDELLGQVRRTLRAAASS